MFICSWSHLKAEVRDRFTASVGVGCSDVCEPWLTVILLEGEDHAQAILIKSCERWVLHLCRA